MDEVNERTAAQAGQQKGIVRETRLAAEAAYKNVVKLLNAMAICETPAGLDYSAAIDRLNAEVEHYRQILARKGVSTGTNSGGDGTTNDNDNENGGGSTDSGSTDGGSTDSGSGSSDSGSDSGSGSSDGNDPMPGPGAGEDVPSGGGDE